MHNADIIVRVPYGQVQTVRERNLISGLVVQAKTLVVADRAKAATFQLGPDGWADSDETKRVWVISGGHNVYQWMAWEIDPRFVETIFWSAALSHGQALMLFDALSRFAHYAESMDFDMEETSSDMQILLDFRWGEGKDGGVWVPNPGLSGVKPSPVPQMAPNSTRRRFRVPPL